MWQSPVEEIKYSVDTKRCGPINVYVSGDLSQAEKKAVFLCVHDMGCNHTVFHQFVENDFMKDIRSRSIFVYVDIPGQEDNAPNLPESYVFPKMQTMGEDLVAILDHLKLKYVFGFGEGAGANILARFGLAHPTRCLGLILLHCTSTVAGVMETFKDKIINWKLSSVGMNQTAEQYLIFHRFGNTIEEQTERGENQDRVVRDFQEKLHSSINPRNLRLFVEAFLNRTDLSGRLAGLNVDVLLVTGGKASHVHTVHTMHQNMNKKRAQLLKIDNVGDVLAEAPRKLAESILLFSQAQGQLTSVILPGVERQRTFSGSSPDADPEAPPRRSRTMSMEEYDQPNLARLAHFRPKDSN